MNTLRKSTESATPQDTALREQAEAIAREQSAQSPEDLEALPSEETRQMLHELRVHQIELEIQNEDLRRAQADLAASQSRYFDLYDLAPMGYVTVSEQGLILEANRSCRWHQGDACLSAYFTSTCKSFWLNRV